MQNEITCGISAYEAGWKLRRNGIVPGDEKRMGHLVNKFKIGQSSISRHLLALRNAGILSSRQEKTTVYYSIHDHDIFKVLRPIAEILRKKLKRSEKLLQHLGRE